MVKNPETYRDKKIIIAGGGDSALDWAIYLSDIAKELTLIHRSDSFRGAPDSADKVYELAQKEQSIYCYPTIWLMSMAQIVYRMSLLSISKKRRSVWKPITLYHYLA